VKTEDCRKMRVDIGGYASDLHSVLGRQLKQILDATGFSCDNGYYSRFWRALLEALCGHRERSCVGWIKAGNKQVIAPQLVLEATE
jgi:hypothetical protein